MSFLRFRKQAQRFPTFCRSNQSIAAYSSSESAEATPNRTISNQVKAGNRGYQRQFRTGFEPGSDRTKGANESLPLKKS